jgi:hypothetical protein
VKGINAVFLRRELDKCDHDAFLAAQAKLAKLRAEALALIAPFLGRLVTSFDEALNASAIEAERRIESEGFSISNGETWTLHNDVICEALWFRRAKAQKVLDEIEPNSAVGAVQFFLSNEEHTPFQWL